MAKTYRKRVKTEGRVENRSDLFNYILAKLTSDSIPVQDDQVHIAIDDAWEKFNNHHHLANEEFFAIYRYTDEDLARFASPPVICLIQKNDRKPFLKSRPFSKSQFYTESFEGQFEAKQNQSYLPVKEDSEGNLSLDSDSVLNGLDHKKAYRYNVTKLGETEEDNMTMILWKYADKWIMTDSSFTDTNGYNMNYTLPEGFDIHNQIFFEKGKNPNLMDDEFIEESDKIADDQWYYLVRKMKSEDEINELLAEPVKGEANYTEKLATYESNVNEYENIIQNDMIDFEKVDRNYLTDKQYGYFFSGGIYWSQANQNDLIVNNIFVDLPEDIGSITKIVNATGQSFGTFFTGLENTALLNSSFASVYGASTAGVGALMQFDMVGFFVMNRHFDMMNKYIVSEQPIGFSFQNKRLYIYDSVKRFVKGDTMMMKGYKRSSNVSQGDLWNNIWLKEYATALTQRQWALNITNASGVTGPGNATLPAQEILAEANTQIEKLETQLYNSLQPGSRIISG